MPENKAKFNKCLKELSLAPFLGSCLWFPRAALESCLSIAGLKLEQLQWSQIPSFFSQGQNRDLQPWQRGAISPFSCPTW